MTQQTIPGGTLTLHPSFHRTEWLRGAGFSLLMLALGAFGVVYGSYIARDLLEVSRIWKEGHESPVEAGYGGRVTTHNFVLKSYNLDVTFLVEETEEPQQFKAEFYRFFTGPDEGESMTVKYMPEDPTRAVTSWQYEGRAHGWVWAAMIYVIGGIGIVACVTTLRATIQLTSTVDNLIRDGQLMLAHVEEAKSGGAANHPLLVVHYRLPRTDEPQKQTFPLKRGAPLFANDNQVVVLSSIDQKQSHILREDGYPLAEVPDLTKLGVHPSAPSNSSDPEEDRDEDSNEDDESPGQAT